MLYLQKKVELLEKNHSKQVFLEYRMECTIAEGTNLEKLWIEGIQKINETLQMEIVEQDL